MGVDTKIYFEGRVTPLEIAAAISKEFGVEADISDIRFEPKRYESDFDRHCGYIRFTYNNFRYSWHFYAYNHIGGGKRDKTNPDTLSSGMCEENKNAMSKIVKYFGGWVVANDCSDEDDDVFFEKTESDVELTNYQKLTNLVCTNIDYKYCDKVIDFIQKNKKILIDLDFGE